MENFETLKIALKMLSAELEEEQKANQLFREACMDLFPFHAYTSTRPDVAEWAKNDKSKIIDHFITYGHKELNIREVIEYEKKMLSNRKLEIVVKHFRDVYDSLNEEDEKRKNSTQRNLIFSKTLGDYRSLDENEAHIFAQKKTLAHLRSNSICTWIPKNACSNLRFSIALENGFISSKNDIGWIHNNTETFYASNKELLKAEYCFVILRNPFKRLLSYFLDKLCHKKSASENDKSYMGAQELFNVTDETTFEQIVSAIWNQPELIEKDIHLIPQCDFLVYKDYDDYFQFEMYAELNSSLEKKLGLQIIDVRDFNTVHTSKGLKTSDAINHKNTVREINNHLKKGEKPIPINMYTNEMTKKMGAIYFNDILLYAKKLNNGAKELEPWINKLVTH
uniref:sulfotransferase family 2 domain-containing protein n=1 Tax=Synechococcus sp. UW106 TaxID=368495 RepID=UPI001A7E07E2|nr:sulfotransferase family 2 domain-containing protein [Synechococcus sp. UW106]